MWNSWLRSIRLKRSEAYANFAKLSTLIRNFTEYNSERFEVYANFARLSTLMSVKFVVAKHSSQTLRKSSSFRTLRRLHELAKLSTLTTLHSVKFIHDCTTTLVMHQACLMLPLYLQSFSGVNRVWPFGELRIPLLHAFPAPNPLFLIRIRNTTLKRPKYS